MTTRKCYRVRGFSHSSMLHPLTNDSTRAECPHAPHRSLLQTGGPPGDWADRRRLDCCCYLGPHRFEHCLATNRILCYCAGTSICTPPYGADEECAADKWSAQVHRRVPALSLPKPTVNEQSDEAPRRHRVFRATKAAITGFQRYFEHPACLPSFALALLYLTVLSFSGQMITYLVSVGLKSYYVTLIRSLSTVFELSATWLAPRAILRIGPIRAASWFLNWQVMWLAASIALFWSEPSALVVACGLSAGTILSRVGLWGFDLGAQSIIQTVRLRAPSYQGYPG